MNINLVWLFDSFVLKVTCPYYDLPQQTRDFQYNGYDGRKGCNCPLIYNEAGNEGVLMQM